jgi:hypothetical protein
VDDAFHVHTENGIISWRRSPGGRLYTYKPSGIYKQMIADTKNPVQLLVSTVKGNMEGFTKQEVDGAKKAQKLYHAMGNPSVAVMKHAIRVNAIKNLEVTTQDVINMEAIFGPDVPTLKGKTTQRKAPVVREDHVEIPKELKFKTDLTLCMDIMHVNKIPMMTSIDKTIRYRSLVVLKNMTKKQIFSGIDDILRLYNGAGYGIKTLRTDQQFCALMRDVEDEMGIQTDPTTMGQHQNEAERNIRTIKERIRAAYNGLPYKALPLVMIKGLALESTLKLNFFPAKGSISLIYSPWTIMSMRQLDYKKHLAIPFGSYVQGTNPTTNTALARTGDGIYLGPVYNKSGGGKIMDLMSGRKITRVAIKEVPLTEVVIKAVEDMAERDNVVKLKFTDRNDFLELYQEEI